MITIINSGYGNFKSVKNMIGKIGFKCLLTNDYDQIIEDTDDILGDIHDTMQDIESTRRVILEINYN